VPANGFVFVRAKKVGRRRYLYLVEGKRSGANVKQKTLCYLGPLSRLVAGVPEEVKKDVDLRLRVDWKKIDDEIAGIPLSFEELAETRRAQFAISVRMRARQGRPTQGNLPRTEGELSALSMAAAHRFEELFEEIGAFRYRMR